MFLKAVLRTIFSKFQWTTLPGFNSDKFLIYFGPVVLSLFHVVFRVRLSMLKLYYPSNSDCFFIRFSLFSWYVNILHCAYH